MDLCHGLQQQNKYATLFTNYSYMPKFLAYCVNSETMAAQEEEGRHQLDCKEREKNKRIGLPEAAHGKDAWQKPDPGAALAACTRALPECLHSPAAWRTPIISYHVLSLQTLRMSSPHPECWNTSAHIFQEPLPNAPESKYSHFTSL